jgi:hypothetical protein
MLYFLMLKVCSYRFNKHLLMLFCLIFKFNGVFTWFQIGLNSEGFFLSVNYNNRELLKCWVDIEGYSYTMNQKKEDRIYWVCQVSKTLCKGKI